MFVRLCLTGNRVYVGHMKSIYAAVSAKYYGGIFWNGEMETETARGIFLASLMCAYYPIAKCHRDEYQLNSLLFDCQSYVRARGIQDTVLGFLLSGFTCPDVCVRVCVV